MNFRPLVVSCLFCLSSFNLAHADTLYKCTDESGAVLYTNQKGGAKRCIVLSKELPVTTMPGAKNSAAASHSSGASTKLASAAPTPSDFPRVDGETQRGRDSDRRRILEQEFNNEQQNLEKARKILADGEATRLNDEKNYSKYLDRVQGLKDNVALHERNVEALRRELANLK